MIKVLTILKKYALISFVFSIIIFGEVTVSSIRSNTLPPVDFLFIVKNAFVLLMITVILIPATALLDLFIVQSAKALFNDYKNADRKGRIIIIVVCIIMLLRKIVIWSR